MGQGTSPVASPLINALPLIISPAPICSLPFVVQSMLRDSATSTRFLGGHGTMSPADRRPSATCVVAPYSPAAQDIAVRFRRRLAVLDPRCHSRLITSHHIDQAVRLYVCVCVCVMCDSCKRSTSS